MSALRMPAIAQAKRMRVMRADVTSFDAAWWARQLIEDAVAAPCHQLTSERGEHAAVA